MPTTISEILTIAKETTSCVTLRAKLEQWNMSIPDGSSQEVTKEVTKKHLEPIIENINKLITDSSVIQHSNSLTNLKEAAAFLITIIERKIHNLTQASTIAAYQAYIDRLNNVIIKEIDDRIAEILSPSPMKARVPVSPPARDPSSPLSFRSDDEESEIDPEAEATTFPPRSGAAAPLAPEAEATTSSRRPEAAATTFPPRSGAAAPLAPEAAAPAPLAPETADKAAARIRQIAEAEDERMRKARYDFTRVKPSYKTENLDEQLGAKAARTLDVLVESLINLRTKGVTINQDGSSYDFMQLILNTDASKFKDTNPHTLENRILRKALAYFHPSTTAPAASNRAILEDRNEMTAFITDLISDSPNINTLKKFEVLKTILKFVEEKGENACLSTVPPSEAGSPVPSSPTSRSDMMIVPRVTSLTTTGSSEGRMLVPGYSSLATGMSAQQLEKDLTDRFMKAIEKHLNNEPWLLGKFHKHLSHLNTVKQPIQQDLMPSATLMDIAPLVRLNHVHNKFRDMLKGYLVTKTSFERYKLQGNIDTLAATYGQILRANHTIQQARDGSTVVVFSREHGAEIKLQGGASVVANAISDPTSAENMGKDDQKARNIISNRGFNC